MDLPRFEALLRMESALADEAIHRMEKALKARDADLLFAALCDCIWHKFLLEGPPGPQDDLLTLSEQSTARIMRLAEGNLQATDISSGCVEADTADTKKILLLLMLKKRLALTFSPERIAETDTVEDLCGLLISEMNSPS